MILPKQTYNPFSGFKPYIPGRPQTQEEFNSELQKMAQHYDRQVGEFVKHFNTETGKHNDTVDTVKRASGVATELTINNLISGSGGSSSGGGGSTIHLRSQAVALVANVSKSVVFSTPIPVTFSITSIRAVNSQGWQVTDLTLSAISATGFTVVAPEDCTLYYMAIEAI